MCLEVCASHGQRKVGEGVQEKKRARGLALWKNKLAGRKAGCLLPGVSLGESKAGKLKSRFEEDIRRRYKTVVVGAAWKSKCGEGRGGVRRAYMLSVL